MILVQDAKVREEMIAFQVGLRDFGQRRSDWMRVQQRGVRVLDACRESAQRFLDVALTERSP